MLVPELAAGAAAELDELREACDAAVARLLAAHPRLLVLLGSAPATREYWYPFRASFARFGVPLEVQLGTGRPSDPPLPLSLAIGVWLLHRASGTGAGPAAAELESGGVGSSGRMLLAEAVAVDAPVEECVEIGTRYARAPGPVGLLVLGDGSACRDSVAPGSPDPRAAEFDAAVTKALAEVDTRGLLALDRGLAAELMAAGRAPLQVLAAAAAGSRLTGEVLYDAAPYGVNYTVAVWA